MELKIERVNGTVVASFDGKLDSNSAPEAQKEILPLAAEALDMVLDMSACNYVSSAGLRVLLMIAKSVSASGGRVCLAGLSEEVKDVMEMTGFGDIFPDYPTTDAALAAMGKEAR